MELTILFSTFIFIYEIRYTFSVSSPLYNWPLAYGSSHAEVETGYSFGGTSCSLLKALPHPALQYNTTQFLGNSNSFVDLRITDINDEEIKDFAFALHISTSPPYTGTLFHYKQDVFDVDGYSHYFKEFRTTINESYVNFKITGPNNETYALFSMPHTLNDTFVQWMSVAVSFDESKGIVRAIDGEGTVITVIANPSDAKIGQPGTIRVGGSLDDQYPSFNGRITCVQMYKDKFQYSDFTDALNKCKTDNWNHMLKESPDMCNKVPGYYKIVAKDAKPSGPNIGSTFTSSGIHCGEKCLKTAHCVAFTINKSQKVCHLYDVYVTYGLSVEIGTNYYVEYFD